MKFLINLQESGERVEALENRPELYPGNVFFMEAFFVLNNSRSITMGGVGSIPLSEISTYASLYEVNKDEIDFFILAIRVMDSIYMDRLHEKMEKKSKDRGHQKTPRRTQRRHGRS